MTKKQANRVVLFFIGLTLWTSVAHAQRDVRIPFQQKKAYVLSVHLENNLIRLDFGENEFSSAYGIDMIMISSTRYLDHLNRHLDPNLIRPGMQVEVKGERLSVGFVASEIKLLTNPADWREKLSGLLEAIDGDTAFIDGKRVVLKPGVKIQGDKAWKRRQFGSFDEMKLGSFVEVEGRRNALDGIVYAEKGKTWPNVFTASERALHAVLAKGLVPPAIKNLRGGQMTIGGTQYQLVSDLKLQAYVNEVGMNLIPAWMDSLPDDDPAKVVFRFYVIEDPTFNAAAYPDGTVIVHTGLLNAIESKDQLAAVLGHEIAHVTHEHSVASFEKNQKKRLVTDAVRILTGEQNGYIQIAGYNIPLTTVAHYGMNTLSNIHSREQENQADRVGLYYMAQAGYQPTEAATIWTSIALTLKAQTPKTKDVVRDAVTKDPSLNTAVNALLLSAVMPKVTGFLFSSHPEASARARNINREVALTYSR